MIALAALTWRTVESATPCHGPLWLPNLSAGEDDLERWRGGVSCSALPLLVTTVMFCVVMCLMTERAVELVFMKTVSPSYQARCLPGNRLLGDDLV